MSGLVYDAGVLVVADRGGRWVWAFHNDAVERGQVPRVPAGVLAQVWRGGPQPQLSRLIASCVIEPMDDAVAREVGQLLGAAGQSDVVDASVIVSARRHRDTVVTGDVADLRRLAEAIDEDVTILEVKS